MAFLVCKHKNNLLVVLVSTIEPITFHIGTKNTQQQACTAKKKLKYKELAKAINNITVFGQVSFSIIAITLVNELL